MSFQWTFATLSNFHFCSILFLLLKQNSNYFFTNSFPLEINISWNFSEFFRNFLGIFHFLNFLFKRFCLQLTGHKTIRRSFLIFQHKLFTFHNVQAINFHKFVGISNEMKNSTNNPRNVERNPCWIIQWVFFYSVSFLIFLTSILFHFNLWSLE